MDRIPNDDQNFFFMLDAFAEALGARLKRAQAEDKKLLSKGPPDSDNLDPATEESEVWEIRTNRWAKESLSLMNEKKKGFRIMKLSSGKHLDRGSTFYALFSQKINNEKTECSGETRMERHFKNNRRLRSSPRHFYMGAYAHGTCGGRKPSEGYAHRCIGYSASQLRWHIVHRKMSSSWTRAAMAI